jgi:hypothetical protein
MALIGAGQVAGHGIRFDDRKGTLDRHRRGSFGRIAGAREKRAETGRLIAVDPTSGKVWASRSGNPPGPLGLTLCAFSHTGVIFGPIATYRRMNLPAPQRD